MKNFFKHTGLAVGYFALFYLIQIWAGYMFILGVLLRGVTSGATLEEAYGTAYNVFSPNTLAIQVTAYAALLILVGALLHAQGLHPLHAQVGLVRPRGLKFLWVPVLLAFTAFGMTAAILSLIPPDLPLMQEYIQSSALLMDEINALTILQTVLVAPFIEELIFRGLVYSQMKKAMPQFLAIILQALLFGLVHSQLLWVLYAFTLGLILGFVADRFGSILPSILLHICFNASNYLPFIVALEGQNAAIVLAVTLPATLALLFFLARKLRRDALPAQP